MYHKNISKSKKHVLKKTSSFIIKYLHIRFNIYKKLRGNTLIMLEKSGTLNVFKCQGT